MKQIWVNKAHIAKVACTIVGGIYALISFVGMLVSLDEILPESIPMWRRLLISCLILIAVWAVCFVIVGIVLVHKKRFQVFNANGGHSLYLQYGDIFDPDAVLTPGQRRNIVIPVNRCFDTIVDNRLISEQTIHGAAFKQLYESGRYTQETLNQAIQDLLCDTTYEDIPIQEKPSGNTRRFPVGTVATLSVDENTCYFLWALSTFDRNLKAHTSMQEYALALQKLVEACNTESEGFSVVVPLVGTGLSRTKKNQRDILSYLVSLFRVNRSEFNSSIHIVVRTDLKNEISIMDIK